MARSSVQEDKPNRTNKHATRACNACRKKKARCEIVVHEGKCERCLSHNIECSIAEGPDHRRPAPRAYVESLEHSLAEQKSRLEEKDITIAALRSQLAGLTLSAPSLYLPSPGPSSSQPLPESPLVERVPRSRKNSDAPSRRNSDLEPKDPSNAPYLSRNGRLVMEGKEIKYYGPTSVFANLPAPWPTIGLPRAASSSSSVLINAEKNSVQRPGCEFDWGRNLPLDRVSLTLQEHEVLIDNFFKYFAGWGYRGIPELFKRDMREALSLPADASSPRLSHYSPMLHNAILSVATAYSDDEELRRPSTRRHFAEKAKEFFQEEGHKPSLSVIQALGHIAAFHSGLAEQLMGSIYFAMCARMAQAVGLGVDSSVCVGPGQMSSEDHRDRTWIYWSLFAHDKFWAFYVGSGVSIPHPPADFPPPPLFTQTPTEVGVVFQETVKLFEVANSILEVIYGQQPVTRELMTDLCLRLEQFFQQVPDHICIKRPKSVSMASPPVIMLHLAYNWLIIMIHRPFYREVCNPCPSASYIKLSVERCQGAAERILQFLDCFDRLHGLQFAPITANQITFTAGTVYLLEAVEFADNAIRRKNALNNVRICVERLGRIGRTWQSARKTAEILKGLLKEQLAPMRPSRAPTVPLILQAPSEAPSRCQSPMIIDPNSLSVPTRSRTPFPTGPATMPLFASIPLASNSQDYALQATLSTESNTVLPDFNMHLDSQASPSADIVIPDIPNDLPQYPANPDLVPWFYPYFHQLFHPLAGNPTNYSIATEGLVQEYQQPFVRMPFSAEHPRPPPASSPPLPVLSESGATALSGFRYGSEPRHNLPPLTVDNLDFSVPQPQRQAYGIAGPGPSTDSFSPQPQGQQISPSIYQQPASPYQQQPQSPFPRPSPGPGFSPADSAYDLAHGWFQKGDHYPWDG